MEEIEKTAYYPEITRFVAEREFEGDNQIDYMKTIVRVKDSNNVWRDLKVEDAYISFDNSELIFNLYKFNRLVWLIVNAGGFEKLPASETQEDEYIRIATVIENELK